MHCPVWHPTRLTGFIFSDLVFAEKDKTHNLSSHESYPLTQVLSATSTEPSPWSSHASHGPLQPVYTKASGVESNKGTGKLQLVLPLTIWIVSVCFGIKGFLCAPKEANDQL